VVDKQYFRLDAPMHMMYEESTVDLPWWTEKEEEQASQEALSKAIRSTNQ
jgi:hypothetical protein